MSTSLNLWLDTLQAVAPMQGALLVGAGAGTSPFVQWLLKNAPEHACLVEAEADRFRHLQRFAATHPSWTLSHGVVAPDETPVSFNRVDNPAESSLLPLSQLKALWPNLLPSGGAETVETGVTLTALLSGPAKSANWLMLDCLPAAPLLEQAGDALVGVDVIAARVVTQEAQPLATARKTTLDLLLKNLGFRSLCVEQERHPALAHALYVRDMRTSLAEKHKRIEQLESDLADLTLRQSLQNAELEKAEKQISLIQDLKGKNRPS